MKERKNCGSCEDVEYFESPPNSGNDHPFCRKAGCNISHNEYGKSRPVWCPRKLEEMNEGADGE